MTYLPGQTAVHDWLSDAVSGLADAVVRLDRDLSAHLGNPAIRQERKEARSALRMVMARAVYAEHPGWVYDRQYRLYMEREREALAQAKQRLAEQTGALR